jgi:hypothetical protein
MGKVTVDFVARDQPHGGWALVLVEQGPWDAAELTEQLRRVQARLYSCLDAALDGQVAQNFPESVGKPLIIRLEAFDLPEPELAQFFERFASGVPKTEEYAAALKGCADYPSINFELNTSVSAYAV